MVLIFERHYEVDKHTEKAEFRSLIDYASCQAVEILPFGRQPFREGSVCVMSARSAEIQTVH